MADVQYWDDTLADEVQSIRQFLQSAEGLADQDKALALDRAEKKIRAAQGTKKAYKTETRLVSHPRQRRLYENKLSELSEELATCANDLKVLKGGAQRGELFVGAREVSSGMDENGEMTGEVAGDMMLNDMNNIQDKTKASLQNTKNMVAASKEVGEATMEELLRQREQIRTIDKGVLRTEDNLNRADKLIKTFGKRMATDRLIQCFACINLLLLAGVVVYSILKKDGDGNVDGDGGSSGAPASPVGGGRSLRGLLNVEQSQDW